MVGKKKKGAVGFTKRLQSVQRTVALAITGALRTSPTDALLSHAGIYPIELELRKAAHRAAVRLAGLSTTNPIQEEVRREASRIGSRGKHPTTLRTLFITSNTNPNDYATAPGTEDFSEAAKHLNPHVAHDKNTAVEEERQTKTEVKIYTDGSMHGGKVGAAAILMREDGVEVISRLHIGKDTEHEVYQAEVYGLLMGLELLARERGRKEADIFIDNQAVLRTLQAGKARNLGHAYARMEGLIKRVRRMNRGIKINTKWVPGHVDVEGNEKADEAAKQAAEGENNTTHHLLPDFLKTKIPINPTAAKRTRRKKMDAEWKEYVGETERTERMRYIDESYPSMKFSKLALTLCPTRQDYATLVQLRLGHFPLATYLHRFNRAESPRCPHCETRAETPIHFLMGCRAHDELRRERDRTSGAASRSIRLLLQPGKHTASLMRYVRGARSQGRD